MTIPQHCLLLIGLLGLGACTSSPAPKGKLLTLENTAGRGERVSLGGKLERWRWAPDGVNLIRGSKQDEVWFDPTGTTQREQPKAEPAPALSEEAQAALDEAKTYEVLDSIEEQGLELCSKAGELYLHRKQQAPLDFRPLTRGSTQAIELAELSPDGKHVAFVQGNNLVLLDCATGERRSLTSDGSVNTFNGKLDWVYQEEIYGRGDFKAFWWSPDSRHVAFLKLDESEVHEFTVVDHIEDGHFRVLPELTKYPKAGDPNPTVQLGVADTLAPSDVRWVDLSRYQGAEPLVARVLWSPRGERLLYMVQDRIQTWLDFNSVDPATCEEVTLVKESSTSWTNRSRPPEWLEDGSFLWLSERSGYRHIYHYSAAGQLLRQLTEGDWAVGSIEHVDPTRGVWFTGARDGAINQNTYRVALDGSSLVRLSQGEGSHRLSFNADRTAFLDRSSSLGSPPSVRLFDGDGELLRVLAVSDMSAQEAYATSAWELHEVETRDGFSLDVALLKPVGFDDSKSYPVWLPTYSGPNALSVRNRWNASSWYQFLAQNGVIVMQVNVRSASGKGLVSTASCYKQLGLVELRDLEDAVAWLCAKPYADASRVGITGHSYGGFMSALALTHSDAFALGLASSGVYDWGMYDTIYTERYMQTPALNPEGYANTSVIRAAANLKGHLVLTHGVMDDNVHFQNAVQLVYALQKAGKSFDFMIYPQQRHGIRDPALRWQARRLEWAAIQEHLLGG